MRKVKNVGLMDGVARYRPEHDVKKAPMDQVISSACLPSIQNNVEHAAVKFVFN